jgi:hypothetical protein
LPLLGSCLDLPSNLSTRKITRSSIWWVITIVSMHVHVSITIPHSFNHRSHISPPTPIASVRSRYRRLDREHFHRASHPRRQRPKERGSNGTIFASWGAVNVGGGEIRDVKHVEGEV